MSSDCQIEEEEYLKKMEIELDSIYKDLMNNQYNNDAIEKFDKIVKSNIDYTTIPPCSKSYEGVKLLTLSKTWMIIILLTINKGNKGKDQQENFISLVNISLSYRLNEYN